jgi:ComF family protein
MATDLVFPPVCLACDRELLAESSEGGLCRECLDSFRYPRGPICPKCAACLPPAGARRVRCGYCRERRYKFTGAFALGIYAGALRQVVLRTKKSAHESLAAAMGNYLGRRLLQEWGNRPVDAVVPVPMHWTRRFARGVPAAELIAEGVARQAGWPLFTDLVYNARATRKQGTLLPGERFRNVAGAFQLSPRYDIAGARIVLVDDVMTTGATLDGIARVLIQQRAGSVHAAVLARGTGTR